jgi:hypothetical protein
MTHVPVDRANAQKVSSSKLQDLGEPRLAQRSIEASGRAVFDNTALTLESGDPLAQLRSLEPARGARGYGACLKKVAQPQFLSSCGWCLLRWHSPWRA